MVVELVVVVVVDGGMCGECSKCCSTFGGVVNME